MILLYFLSPFEGDGDKSKKKKKKEDTNGSTDEGSDEDRPRKRGRPRASTREAYKGFTDAEVIIDTSKLCALSTPDSRLNLIFRISDSKIYQKLQKVPRTVETSRSGSLRRRAARETFGRIT